MGTGLIVLMGVDRIFNNSPVICSIDNLSMTPSPLAVFTLNEYNCKNSNFERNRTNENIERIWGGEGGREGGG